MTEIAGIIDIINIYLLSFAINNFFIFIRNIKKNTNNN